MSTPHLKAHHRRRAFAMAFVAAAIAVFAVTTWAVVAADSAGGSPTGDPNYGHKVSICHATSSATNPFTFNTVDVAAGGLKGGHQNHAGDIIPPFTYIDKDGDEIFYPGKNMGTDLGGYTGSELLANGCVPPEEPPAPIDVCPNIDGDQETVPDGLVVDDEGNCVEPADPTDVCPNIEGNQETVPPGLFVNDDGDCVEPDEPPTPIDLCPNIDGNQETIPDGHHVDNDGNCVQPEEPVDVCPNIDGDQDTVPDGMYIDDAGDCVEPTEPPGPGDVCPNIDGDQTEVPEGMVLEDGACIVEGGGDEPDAPGTADAPAEAGPEAADAVVTPVPTGNTVEIEEGQELPFTGAEETALFAVGLLLLLAGIGFEVGARRAHKAHEDAA